nr:hypothetical protein [Tanacetum cinerariifolium]
VPFAERIKISSSNIRLETTVPQKEETFQVVIDIINNSMCFKAFTLSVDIPEILMQQFGYTIKKVQGTDSYEFLLANKKQTVNAEVFRKILDICPRVEGVDFMDILPKKSRGKGLQGKKTTHVVNVDVSEEFKPEPAKKKTSSKRRVKKKVTLSADDNIIFDDPDTALELESPAEDNLVLEAQVKDPLVNQGLLMSPQSSLLPKGDKQDSKYSDDDNDDVEKDDKDDDADDEGDDHISDTQDADNEDVTNAAKDDVENTIEVKDDTKKTKHPPISSSLSASSGFDDKFLKLSFDSSLVSSVKDSVDTDVSSLMNIPIQHETPHIQSLSVRKVYVLVIPETTHLPPIPEILTETLVPIVIPSPQVTPIISSVQKTPTRITTQPITTDAPTITTAIPESNALTVVELRVAKLKKNVSELKTVDHSTKALVELQKHTTDLIHKYSLQHLPELIKKPTPTAEQETKKSPSDILRIKKEQAKKQKKPQVTIKSIDKAALKEYDLKSALHW